MLKGMGIAGSVEVHYRDDSILLDTLCGEDSDIAIGRKGQTLEALQVLVNRIVAKEYPSSVGTRILLDIEGYRERRRSNLLDMARRAAESVRESGEPSFLSPLNSYERYLVHSAMKDEPGIVTSSRGDGAMKEILISPSDSEGDN